MERSFAVSRRGWIVLALVVGGWMAGAASAGGNTQTPAEKAWARVEEKRKQADALRGIQWVVRSPQLKELERYLDRVHAEANRECDRAMESPLPVDAINAMVDDVAQYMVREIGGLREVKEADRQFVLAFADIGQVNTPNSAVREALNGLKARLARDERIRRHFLIVETTESQAAEVLRVVSGNDISSFRDPLQREIDQTRPEVYHPDYVYFVSGAFGVAVDREKHVAQVTLSTTFEHVRSRQAKLTHVCRKTYMWNPSSKRWELQP